MRTIAYAAAFALAALPQLAPAQEMDEQMMAQMQEGLTMLESNVARIFQQYDVEADPMALSLNQIATIIGAEGSQDGGAGRLTKSRIETIIN